MKSSPRMIGAVKHPALVQDWLPKELDDDFTPGEMPANAASIENAFSAFSGTQNNPTDVASVEDFVKPSKRRVVPVAWIPGEIEIPPPAPKVVVKPAQTVQSVTPVQAEQPPVQEAPAGPSIDEKIQTMLDNAKNEAERIIADAQAQAAEIVRQARETGLAVLAESRESGYQSGMSRAEKQAKSIIEASQAILREMNVWREAMLAQSESEVLNLVKTIAIKLFGDGIHLDEENLSQTFSRILTEGRALGDLRVYLNPSDAMTLGPYWQEQQSSYRGQKIELIPSEAIQPGGCFVEGQYGSVDGRLESQFGLILNAISNNTPQAVVSET